MEIKQIRREDIWQVVSIHKDAFAGFFLTQLGDDFLNLYYTSVLQSRKGILIGYYEGENDLCGFASATSYSRGFHTSLIKENIWSYAWIGLKILFKSPKALKRLYENLTKTDKSVCDSGEYAELLSIGVGVNSQRKGIGHLLLQEVEQKLAEQKVREISLTTDFCDNYKALNFYKSMGYSVMYDFVSYPNRRMYRLIKELNR